MKVYVYSLNKEKKYTASCSSNLIDMSPKNQRVGWFQYNHLGINDVTSAS